MEYADVCHTANTGRAQFDHRLALVAPHCRPTSASVAAISQRRRAPTGSRWVMRRCRLALESSSSSPVRAASTLGMGRRLYRTEPAFRRTLDMSRGTVGTASGAPAARGDARGVERCGCPARQAAFAQPALFAFEYALAELWRSWGVEPIAVIGHGLGELVAAVRGGRVLGRGRRRVGHCARPLDAGVAGRWCDGHDPRGRGNRADGGRGAH